jgi:hypothetical protein
MHFNKGDRVSVSSATPYQHGIWGKVRLATVATPAKADGKHCLVSFDEDLGLHLADVESLTPA